MKKSFRYIVMSLVLLLGVSAPKAFAGNEDRSGQAGAPELLINPWAASAGWGPSCRKNFLINIPTDSASFLLMAPLRLLV